MRGGKIYVRDHAGYRAGIHMKEYKKKVPIMIIGGCAGSFLGEYQAGGILIVLGLQEDHHRSSAISPVPVCTAESCFCGATAGI